MEGRRQKEPRHQLLAIHTLASRHRQCRELVKEAHSLKAYTVMILLEARQSV